MGVAVLKPEDCLKLPFPMKHPKDPSSYPCRNHRRQPSRKKKASPASPPNVGSKSPSKNLVMGQVRILKRGEDPKKTAPLKDAKTEKAIAGADLGSTNRLGPDPVSVPTQIRLKELNNIGKAVPAPFYAGSAFFTSPPPSSVPMPAFFTKKMGFSAKADDATSDLRRILRLDL